MKKKSVEIIPIRRAEIQTSRLLLLVILILEAFISNRIASIKSVVFFWCLYCRVV